VRAVCGGAWCRGCGTTTTSLRSGRLISRIRSTLDVELAIRSLFEVPTVEALVQRMRDAQAARPALRALPRPAEVPLPYASAGCGSWTVWKARARPTRSRLRYVRDLPVSPPISHYESISKLLSLLDLRSPTRSFCSLTR
jgi:hypothetical protein